MDSEQFPTPDAPPVTCYLRKDTDLDSCVKSNTTTADGFDVYSWDTVSPHAIPTTA